MARRRNRFLIGAALSTTLLGSFAGSLRAQTASPAPKPGTPTARLTELQEWEVVWDELGGFDEARVTRAIWTLIAAPERTVGRLEERVRPIAEADPVKVAGWIADLNSSKYRVRDRAELELRTLGESVAPALREALKKPPSAEVRYRAERLLARAVDKKTTPDRVRAARAIAVLERIGSKDSLRVLDSIAQGSPAARETQLARAAVSRLKPLLEPSDPTSAKTAATTVNGR